MSIRAGISRPDLTVCLLRKTTTDSEAQGPQLGKVAQACATRQGALLSGGMESSSRDWNSLNWRRPSGAISVKRLERSQHQTNARGQHGAKAHRQGERQS